MPALPAGNPTSPPSNAPGDGGRAQVYLHAGDLVVASKPTAIVTILGSCVAVCLFAPAARVGGLNHYLLPTGPDEASPRFGHAAVRLLVRRLLALGARRHELRAKLFGGAGILADERRPGLRVGDQNVALAVALLAEEGIPTLDGDVGGPRGRKIIFHTDTGDVWVKTL